MSSDVATIPVVFPEGNLPGAELEAEGSSSSVNRQTDTTVSDVTEDLQSQALPS